MENPKVKRNASLTESKRDIRGRMVRGKFAERLMNASSLIVLDPEVQERFPNSQAVNDALRGLIELARATGLSQKPVPKIRKRHGH